MNARMNLSESVIFPKGKRADPDHFIGTAWVEALNLDDSTYHCPIWNVTFEPGGRNNWHKHPAGQILLVTGGRGYYQEEGKLTQELHPGDIVRIPPNVKHWHGAAPNSWLTHLALCPNTQKESVVWFEPVADEAYNHLK